MSLIIEDKAVVNVVYWCSACGKLFGMTVDRSCGRSDKHSLVPIYVEADSTLDDVLSADDFGEGD
jgi:hypothetical protein